MKKFLLFFAFDLFAMASHAQTTIAIKDAVNYVGKQVTLCDSVYSARAMDNLSLMNLGGKFPKELLTVVVFKADRANFEKEPVGVYEHQRICVTGTVTLYKEKLQIVVNDPKQLKLAK